MSDLKSRVLSRGGVFGTSSERMEDRTPKDAVGTPGPGNYHTASRLTANWLRQRHKKASSAFASESSRFHRPTVPTAPDYSEVEAPDENPKGDPALLGPGAYQLPDQWAAPNSRKWGIEKAAGFLSNSDRFSRGLAGPAGPGPGQYAVEHRALAMPSKFLTNPDCGFSTRNERFKDATTFTPGPGHYRPEESSTMIKRSFNATVDGYVVA